MCLEKITFQKVSIRNALLKSNRVMIAHPIAIVIKEGRIAFLPNATKKDMHRNAKPNAKVPKWVNAMMKRANNVTIKFHLVGVVR